MNKTNSHGERDLKRGRRLRQVAMLAFGITFLVYCPLASAAEGTPRVLGSVVALGKASMKTGSLDRWVVVDEKTHPVIDGAALKTEDGTMSVTMKDGANIEVGKRTDLVLNGSEGSYLMRLQLGTIAFKIYEGTGLFVTTPSTSVVVQRASGAIATARHTAKEEISGIITHDGKETQVICQRGKFSVMRASAETLILSEGNRVDIADPLAVSSPAQTASSAGSGAPSASSAQVRVYEDPAKVPEILQQANTGGLEVVSEHTP
jgi:ferric-dicitrate binding protein FerR (iron transport regulator)